MYILYTFQVILIFTGYSSSDKAGVYSLLFTITQELCIQIPHLQL